MVASDGIVDAGLNWMGFGSAGVLMSGLSLQLEQVCSVHIGEEPLEALDEDCMLSESVAGWWTVISF